MDWENGELGDGREGNRAWYVIHTYSGYENKVKANLESKIASQGLGEEIFNVVVPLETVAEKKEGGKEKTVKRKVFPGYVLVEMIVNNRSWYVVRNTQGVTGFVGSEKDPIPLTPEEVERILKNTEFEKTPPAVKYKIGDKIRIKSGWLEDQIATVTQIDTDEKSVRVEVNGKSVDLDFTDVEKV